MGVAEVLDGLELYNNPAFDEEIRLKGFIEFEPLILNADGNLSFNRQSPSPELMSDDYLIDRFQ